MFCVGEGSTLTRTDTPISSVSPMNAAKNAITRARVCVYIANSTFLPTLPTLLTPKGMSVALQSHTRLCLM